MHTCSLQCAGALYFNDAHPAAADLVDVLEVAESRYIDVHFLCSLKDRIVFRDI